MLPALALAALGISKLLFTADVVGNGISRAYGYKKGEGPLSGTAQVRMAKDSDSALGRFIASLVELYPQVMPISVMGKTFSITESEEAELLGLTAIVRHLAVRAATATEEARFNPWSSISVERYNEDTMKAVEPVAAFFKSFPLARVK